MKLTKKCRRDFKDWYLDLIECDRADKFAVQLEMDIFDQMLDSAKFGIIIDFADFAGCYLTFMIDWVGYGVRSQETGWKYPSKKHDGFVVIIDGSLRGSYKTRAEARVKAVEMFNDHYNSTKLEAK